MNIYPGKNTSSVEFEEKIEKKTDEIRLLLREISKAKEALARASLGNDIVDRAQTMIAFIQSDDMKNIIPEDLQEELDDMKRAEQIQIARTLLQCEPADEFEDFYKTLTEDIILPTYFPNETTLSALDSDDTLANIGHLLTILEGSFVLRGDSDVNKYQSALRAWDTQIAKQYTKFMGTNESLEVDLDDNVFELTLVIDGVRETNSTKVEIDFGKLFYDGKMVENEQQLHKVEVLMRPFKEILATLRDSVNY
ncbi:MAG: hypothetical protein Q7T74_03695 [Candidatus Saccharibacteria bacterium]|nr:hypothetical protein [Candidatus Saccharibacteria bacterium]